MDYSRLNSLLDIIKDISSEHCISLIKRIILCISRYTHQGKGSDLGNLIYNLRGINRIFIKEGKCSLMDKHLNSLVYRLHQFQYHLSSKVDRKLQFLLVLILKGLCLLLSNRCIEVRRTRLVWIISC